MCMQLTIYWNILIRVIKMNEMNTYKEPLLLLKFCNDAILNYHKQYDLMKVDLDEEYNTHSKQDEAFTESVRLGAISFKGKYFSSYKTCNYIFERFEDHPSLAFKDFYPFDQSSIVRCMVKDYLKNGGSLMEVLRPFVEREKTYLSYEKELLQSMFRFAESVRTSYTGDEEFIKLEPSEVRRLHALLEYVYKKEDNEDNG